MAGTSARPPKTTTTAAAAAYADFLDQQRAALTHWKADQQKKRLSLQKVSMSGDSQDMVADLLHEITGTDAEEVLFQQEEQMNELGAQLQHSAEAKFLLRALLEMRFRRDHAQQACAFVFAENAGELAGKDTLLVSALDWLCLHIEDKHLPCGTAPANPPPPPLCVTRVGLTQPLLCTQAAVRLGLADRGGADRSLVRLRGAGGVRGARG